jgi:hypothetical protein
VLTTALLIILILGLGTHLSDGVRVRQEEAILHKLPVAEAHAYYELLKKRARRVRLLRAITLASLALALMAARRRFFPPPRKAAVSEGAPTAAPTHTQAARVLADAALARHAAAAGLDAGAYQPPSVSGDDQHPWIFEYRAQSGTRAAAAGALRIYVNRQGRTEVHQIVARP